MKSGNANLIPSSDEPVLWTVCFLWMLVVQVNNSLQLSHTPLYSRHSIVQGLNIPLIFVSS
jgi:hypothetical protein